MPRYRRLSEEVMVSRITPEGELQDPNFPIPVTIERQEGQLVDGLCGPVPWFKVSWKCYPHLEAEVLEVPLCDVLAARPYVNCDDAFYLTVISDYDLSHKYERINDERDEDAK